MEVHSATVPQPKYGEIAAIAMMYAAPLALFFGFLFGIVKLVKWIWNF